MLLCPLLLSQMNFDLQMPSDTLAVMGLFCTLSTSFATATVVMCT